MINLNIDEEILELNIEIQRNPNNHHAKQTKSILLNNKALHLSKLDKNQEALKLINESIELDSHNPGFFNNKAVFLSKMGKLTEAVESVSKALELDPDNKTAKEILSADLNNQFTVDVRNEKYDDALQKINRAIELRPNEIIFHCNKASVLNKLEKYAEGLEAANKAMEIDSTNVNAKKIKSILLNQLALEDETNKRFEDALAKINEAIELRPNEIGHFINKGSILLSLHRLDDADEAADRALELDKDNKDAKVLKNYVLKRKSFNFNH